jgi:D-methionine transport system ATP-binding protein
MATGRAEDSQNRSSRVKSTGAAFFIEESRKAKAAIAAGRFRSGMAHIIEVKDLCKTFETKDGTVEALKDISLDIDEGDVYGIIGMSGAGKSTLVRCLNYLEKPTSGEVCVEGRKLSELSDRELRSMRSSIGMIFQGFNLLMQRSVIDNVCFPLEILGRSRTEALQKARELLATVDLSSKEKSYPAQLSGGQKQRVAIARALASDPKILLCDEATSTLDPQTTQSILTLLRRINHEMGITIVIITHQMSVVREICNNVAIIEDGRLVEQGAVLDIFTHPRSRAARRLIVEGKDPDEWNGETEDKPEAGQAESWNGAARQKDILKEARKIRIVFTKNSSFEPVIANLILQFGTPVNILRVDTRDVGGTAVGDMILGLPDDEKLQESMVEYLKNRGLEVEEADGNVER